MRLDRNVIWGAVLCAALSWGCSDDTKQNNPTGDACEPGEVKNPITGVCQLSRMVNNPQPDMDTGDTGLNMPRVMVDVSEADKCNPNLDSDSDGLDNECECLLGTKSGDSDSDEDGLPDGYEDSDGDCLVGPTETQATVADTDSDGIPDGEEIRLGLDPLRRDSDEDGIVDGIEKDSCTDALKADTDGDGVPDGAEDINRDGKLGTCEGRAYTEACAAGEYDPCNMDTDGDGTPDGNEVAFFGCRQEFLDQLPPANLVTNMAGDYQLSLDPVAQGAAVTGLGQGEASVFNHKDAGYAGFILSLPKAPATPTPSLRDTFVGQIQSTFPGSLVESNGRQVRTHDRHDAFVSIKLDIGRGGDPAALRDQLLGALAGGTPASSLSDAFPVTVGNAMVIAGIVDRGDRSLLTVSVVGRTTYETLNSKSGWLVDDVTSSMSVADAVAEMEEACVDFEAPAKPKVDYLWVIDGSGSMSEENDRVRQFANDFVGILDQRNIDYRLGVVSSHCYKIWDETDLTPQLKALFGTPQDAGACAPPPIPFPGIDMLLDLPYKNGKLCDGGYTRDPAKFASCVNTMARQSNSNEHTATISTAALARSLPRAENDPQRLRSDAATVVISVTDEFDDLFQSRLGWSDAGSGDNPPEDPTTRANFDSNALDAQVQPFVNYLLSTDIGATLFGIIWIPGQSDACGAAEAAAGIERMASKTGGTVGSLCGGQGLQNTLQQIAAASAGLASGLRLRGIPVPSSVVVRIGRVEEMMIDILDRARDNGWDYDQVTNAVAFLGNAIPKPSDRVVVAYRRWKGSISICMSDRDCPTNQKFRCIEGECR